MNSDFLKILTTLRHATTLDELKQAYRKAAKAFHPDLNPGIDDTYMKKINSIYDMKIRDLKDTKSEKKAASQAAEAEWFREIIVDLIRCEGLEIEVCGWFIWIGGNTKVHKDIIKEKGFRWSSNKSKWYHKPDWYRGHNTKPWDMDEIREKYGSQKVRV
jgi:hypothetical protein